MSAAPASGARTAEAVSPARACAYAVLRRVFEQEAYADRAFHAEARGLEGRERAFAMALAYGAVQRVATLDHIISQLSDRPAKRLDPPLLAALRLGVLQLLLLDGVAEHAAVHESVELAKRSSRGGAGLVNAVLRRTTREGPGSSPGWTTPIPEHAAVLHSVPRWLAQLWWRELGADRARSLLAAINRPPESALRINTLVGEPATIAASLGVTTRPAEGAGGSDPIPEGVVIDGQFDVFASPQWAAGAIMPQSRGVDAGGSGAGARAGRSACSICAPRPAPRRPTWRR